jgi:hypothetical protein
MREQSLVNRSMLQGRSAVAARFQRLHESEGDA